LRRSGGLTGAIDNPKRGVGQADVYQMMAYAQVYQCDRLMLLYPHHAEMGAPEGVLDRHRIRGKDDTQLSIATVSPSDLSDVGDRLVRMVQSTIAGMPQLAAV
jgi:5-methylcytosine-specific restriction enzyme subunit McrC